jgi:hypothetical protein
MSLDIYLTENHCAHCGQSKEVFSANITHNLCAMAKEACVYGVLWSPEENGIQTAGQLIEPLQQAIYDMIVDPPRFKAHDSPNGWGTYEDFLLFLKDLLSACMRHADATVRASR